MNMTVATMTNRIIRENKLAVNAIRDGKNLKSK